MKKVLILTSIKTGSGHRSSSNAIEKKLKDKGFDTKQLDVFPLMGKMGNLMENSYIPLTTKAPLVYYFCQRVSEYFPWYIHTEMYFRIRKNLLKEIEEFRPDLIISVQCMFTRSISHMIRKYKLNIPFYVGVIDLMEPPSVWRDKKADITFVPTETIRDDYLRRGFDPERVLVSGFPVRDDIIERDIPKKVEKPIRILMVNTSTNLDKNEKFLSEVSRLDDVAIDFICGLDKPLYKALVSLKEEGKLKDNVNIHGYVNNMNEFLNNAHMLLTKAGPNVIVEAIHAGTPIVITGHIHGQEDDNYRYVLQHGLGIVCEDPEKIYEKLYQLISSDKLEQCLNNITKYNINNGAQFIADYTETHI